MVLFLIRWTMTTILYINTGRRAGNSLQSDCSPTSVPEMWSFPKRRATGAMLYTKHWLVLVFLYWAKRS